MQKTGLTSSEAAARLNASGENRLDAQKGQSTAAMFFSQFKDVMIAVLAVSSVISALMGQSAEAITILAIVIMNAVMGFVQEYRTEKTLEALKELSAPTAHVIRDGAACKISAREIVQGDVVLLAQGDIIPADASIIESTAFSSGEAMLTGESDAVHKSQGDNVFAGCTVQSGHASALVTATGMNTEMGKIASLIDKAENSPTPLQLKLKQLGKIVAAACVIVCLLVGMLGYLQGGELLEMLLTGVSLAVAAIPEGLPAIVTITLALSVGRILKRGAVIRKLPAVETLGCAGVICTDKTGTLTQNKMTVAQLDDLTIDEAAHRKNDTQLKTLLSCAVLCSSAQPNTTEDALLKAAAQFGITRTGLQKGIILSEEIPFDSRRKRMTVRIKANGKPAIICKGAPDVLLPMCRFMLKNGVPQPLNASGKDELSRRLDAMAQKALRVIAVAAAYGTDEKALCFIGMFGIRDPLRAEVPSAVRKCRTAGIKPVMITGDYRQTALAAAKDAGIYRHGDSILTGTQLDEMSDAQLAKECMQTSVYARVTPEHKLRIVRAYKACGQIAAMTGDGVNDAPAVKEADIGVAMGSGSDVTKQAAGVVVLDDNFATIVAAVEEGRVIYQNIRRFIRFLLTSNLGEVLSMVFAMLLGLPASLSPIQILLVNLFTDGLPAIALGVEPPSENIMRREPRKKSEGLFAHGLWRVITIRGTMLAIASCGAYYAALEMGASLSLARSTCFFTIVVSQMIHIFECRGVGLHFLGNTALIFAASASVVSTICSIYIPALQGIFGTSAVHVIFLLPVFVGASIGPMATAIWRFIIHTKNE